MQGPEGRDSLLGGGDPFLAGGATLLRERVLRPPLQRKSTSLAGGGNQIQKSVMLFNKTHDLRGRNTNASKTSALAREGEGPLPSKT